MSDQQPQLSRRDWFRLDRSRSTPSETTSDEASPRPESEARLGDKPSSGMTPVSEPVNHGGINLSDLPPMREAILGVAEVEALFADLKEYASNVQLIARSRNTGAGGDHSPRLAEACERLVSGDVRKMQVRYEWQDVRWIDTFEIQDAGIRLVRIQHG